MKILAIIPARGGSKGVLRKNIRLVQGKPLIAYSIELGQACESFMDTVVSTDDDKIETIALQLNAKVIKRPSVLGSDVSNVADSVQQVLQKLKDEEDKNYDIVILLQPTSPLRTKNDIENVLNFFRKDAKVGGVVSVVRVVDYHPARMYDVDENGAMDAYISEMETARRQDLPPLYIRNGCIYAVRTAIFSEKKTLMPPNKRAYVMDERWSVNVDTETDLELLEIVLPKWKAFYENTNN